MEQRDVMQRNGMDAVVGLIPTSVEGKPLAAMALDVNGARRVESVERKCEFCDAG
jgi:hypothetical protein